ncbi:MAG TPA: hypothetical protein VLE21_04525 [Candidatus Nitrosocosmicus sp.]|nr:hypothetical protein [Candidatus Nitrosocosmicus sp.]
MTNDSLEKKSEANRRIILTEKEVSEIERLYAIAIELSNRSSSNSLSSDNMLAGQNDPFNTLINFDSSANTLKRKKAWHDVQEYLDRLGRKYDYDPEKFVINKITRELEPYYAQECD